MNPFVFQLNMLYLPSCLAHTGNDVTRYGGACNDHCALRTVEAVCEAIRRRRLNPTIRPRRLVPPFTKPAVSIWGQPPS